MKMLLGPTALPTSGLGTWFKCHRNGHLLRVDGWAVPPVWGLVHDSLLHMQASVAVEVLTHIFVATQSTASSCRSPLGRS
jgi:hypothetical protein